MPGKCCAYCRKTTNEIGRKFVYTINPAGGFGLPEVLACEDCVRANPELRRRLIEVAGFTDEQINEFGDK